MTGVSLELDDRAWRRYLKTAEARAADLTPAMREVARILDREVRHSFQTQTDPWGALWEPWKNPDAIMKSRMRRNSPGGSAILFDEGLLFSSITPSWDTGGAAVSVGENNASRDYAEVHQWGNENTPQRAFLPIAEEGASPLLPAPVYEEVTGEVIEFLEESFK